MILKNNRIGPVLVASLALALATAMPLPAFAQSASAMPTHTAMAAPSTDVGMKMRKSMDDMHEKMGQMKMSGDVDHDFVMLMKSHHQGAIEMAQMEVDSGKDAAAIKSAKKIISAQKKEIAAFDDWLSKHPMK
ncbi:uncharacterized protein (DUF305 family) [Janthinobacterium sp. CG_23.3]|uniref:DUF305 domain-containing protein n=1 Tax=Janthinobacterium sp. CG_23.3 TaxID=3349634 RepID=UPI0038D37D08